MTDSLFDGIAEVVVSLGDRLRKGNLCNGNLQEVEVEVEAVGDLVPRRGEIGSRSIVYYLDQITTRRSGRVVKASD